MVKITLSFPDDLARKAYLLLVGSIPTDDELNALSKKEVDVSEFEKDDKEQALMMTMALIGAAL